MAEKNVLIDLNLNNNEIQNVVLQNLAAEPTGKEGKIYYDSASGVKAPKFYDGTTWKQLAKKDELPVVNNATLTIQKNGVNVQTFTANASANKTANITVPTKTSEVTNDSGFITKEVNNLTNYTKTSDLPSVATSGNFADLKNKPTTIAGYGITDAYTKHEANALLPVIPKQVSAFINDVGYLTKHQDISGKQDKLTTAQLNAANSGITAAKVATYNSTLTYESAVEDRMDEEEVAEMFETLKGVIDNALED